MSVPSRPTTGECEASTVVEWVDKQGYKRTGVAAFTPQVGGYPGACVIELFLGNKCFNVWVWHDGEFPTGELDQPVSLHFCDVAQFETFAREVKKAGEILFPKAAEMKGTAITLGFIERFEQRLLKHTTGRLAGPSEVALICSSCHGVGVVFGPLDGREEDSGPCPDCQGTGRKRA
jgi:hypothetical protein